MPDTTKGVAATGILLAAAVGVALAVGTGSATSAVPDQANGEVAAPHSIAQAGPTAGLPVTGWLTSLALCPKAVAAPAEACAELTDLLGVYPTAPEAFEMSPPAQVYDLMGMFQMG